MEPLNKCAVWEVVVRKKLWKHVLIFWSCVLWACPAAPTANAKTQFNFFQELRSSEDFARDASLRMDRKQLPEAAEGVDRQRQPMGDHPLRHRLLLQPNRKNDKPDLSFFHFPFYQLSSVRPLLPSFTQLAFATGLGNQGGSTTDHLANCFLPSTPKYQSTMRAEQKKYISVQNSCVFASSPWWPSVVLPFSMSLKKCLGNIFSCTGLSLARTL